MVLNQMQPRLPIGTRRLDVQGYVVLKVGKDHHLSMKGKAGWAHEHRVVMEKKIGRRLKSSELVHHRDHDRTNNDPDNLELQSRREHMAEHRDVARRYKRPFCPRGHLKTEFDNHGYPRCAVCRREWKRRYNARKRQDAAVAS